MSMKFDEIWEAMVNAVETSFKESWPQIKDYATTELDKIATTLVSIETLYKTNQISKGESSILFEMQLNSARAVLLAIQGMTLILVEKVINNALEAVKDIVNGLIGFTLIG